MLSEIDRDIILVVMLFHIWYIKVDRTAYFFRISQNDEGKKIKIAGNSNLTIMTKRKTLMKSRSTAPEGLEGILSF